MTDHDRGETRAMSDLNALLSSCSLSSSAVSQHPEPGSTFHQVGWHDPLQVPESDTLRKGVTLHHHGHIYNTTNVHNAPVTTIGHADNVNVRVVADEDIALLESLPKQPDISGQWNDYLKDSRRKEIEEIRAWADRQATGLLLWIHAAAGLGKSTLARQLKHYLHSQGRLAAAVFLSQLPTDSLGPETVIKLIGGELGRTHRGAVPAIAKAVRESHGASIQVQLESYVRDPLLLLNLPYPLIVILDAIDEWRSHYHLISELGHLTSHSSLIRFVVLSRSEPRERLYKNIPIQPYLLQPVSVEVMQEYLDARFDNIEWEFGRKPTTNEVVCLATMANGVFIWLSIVCSLLDQSRSSPQDTLTAILHSRRTIGNTNHQLASLYFKAIDHLFPQPGDKDDLRTFLGYTMVLQEPLRLDAFSQLSGLSAYSITRIGSSLKALQIRQPVDSGNAVYPASNLFHASFIEYLQSTSVQPDIAFPISSSTFHSQLGEACLGVIGRFIPTSLNLDKLYLSPACKYAVLYWAWHISRWLLSTNPGVDVNGNDKLQGSVLRGQGALELLRQWAPIFIRSLKLDVTSDPPSGDSVNALLRGVADLVDTAEASAVVFKIPCLEIAVHVAPDNAESWSELGRAYGDQADVDNSFEFVQRAVVSHQRAVDIAQGLPPDQHLPYLRTLASSLWLRSERTGAIEDLSKSLSLEREILTLCPAGHCHHSTSLHNLARSLFSRFQQSGAVGDLEEAIALQREALALRPHGHPDRPMSLNNLANSVLSRFEQSGTVRDLEEGIALYREALALCPYGHPNHSSSLNNLADSLHSHFRQFGAVGDLEEAIALLRETLALRPYGHLNRSSSLNNLADILHSHFRQSGTVGDLEEAIALQREALALRPYGHPNRSLSLNNLANSLHSRLQQSGTVGDLEEVIALQKEALTLRPYGHPDRPSSLSDLGNSLLARFRQSGTVKDLEEAIILTREALSLQPLGHPRRTVTLYRLRLALQIRFGTNGTTNDFHEAVSLAQEEFSLYTPDSPYRVQVLQWLSSHGFVTSPV